MLHLQLSDNDVERLIAGDQPQDRPDYAEVALLMRRLRAEGAREQAPPMSPLLLAELDKAEAEAAEAQRSRRAETRRQMSEARRRWRVMAAAAAVVVVAGIAVAHTQGAFSASEPTQTIDASSGGAELGTDDERGGDGGDGRDDTATAAEPEVDVTVTTVPPPTDPPATDPPATEPAGRTGDGDHENGDGDHPGPGDGPWDDGDARWGDGDGDARWTERGLEIDFDGPGGRPPVLFEHAWLRECGDDHACLWDKWTDANGYGDGDGPDVYSHPGP